VKPIDVAVTRLAARQYSLAQRQQALDLGMTPRQLHDRLESGWLVPVHRAVYRLAGSAPSQEQAYLAACLAAGPGAVASHRSAAALWGLRGIEDAPAEITVPGDRHCRLTDVVVHRTDRLDENDVSRRRRIPVTTPARTLLDAGVLRALVEERDPATAPTQSMLEDLLFGVLRRGGLPAPVRQYEVGGVLLDGAYPEVRLGLEADSRVWHGGRLDVQRNSEKANILLAHGWRVLHFTWFDLTRRAPYVVGTVGGQLELAWPA
jgi:very-short-patch-repair endonuclease